MSDNTHRHIWNLIGTQIDNAVRLRNLLGDNGADFALKLLETIGAESIDNYFESFAYTSEDKREVDEALDQLGVDKPVGGEVAEEVPGVNETISEQIRKAELAVADAQRRAADAAEDLARTRASAQAELDDLNSEIDRTDRIRQWFTSQTTIRDVVKTVGETEADDALIDAATNRIGELSTDGKPALSTWTIAPPHDSWGEETVEAEILDIDPTEGIHAYIGDDLVFHAPAGTYSYVRKVA